MVRFSFALGILVLAGCTGTEMRMAHENPLDRIFDSGSFRLVLTGEATSATVSTLSWGSVYYTSDAGKISELSSEDIQASGTNGSQVFYSAAAPGATDIAAVKQGGTLSGSFAAVCTLTTTAAGSCTATPASGTGKGYYIIRLDYKYDNKTGRIYSNFAGVQ